jgi:hypothetical protein
VFQLPKEKGIEEPSKYLAPGFAGFGQKPPRLIDCHEQFTPSLTVRWNRYLDMGQIFEIQSASDRALRVTLDLTKSH